MVPSWESLLFAQANWLKATGFKLDFDPTRERTAVIVEPRSHPMLRAVVDNMMNALGSGWNLMVFTAATNQDWLRESLAPHDYAVKYLSLANLTIAQYSQLLMTPEFWEAIPTEHILIFQTDTLALRPWNPLFEEYDYLGGNYFHPADTLDLNGIGGIQGGLSYRKRSAMIACLRAITEADVVAYRCQRGLPETRVRSPMAEDVYFTHATAMLNKHLPSVRFRPLFSLEAEYYDAPFGLHGWNHPYFTDEQRHRLCWESPILRPFLLLLNSTMKD
jgi:hypothetical protein